MRLTSVFSYALYQKFTFLKHLSMTSNSPAVLVVWNPETLSRYLSEASATVKLLKKFIYYNFW